jgi:hypothetical protein
MHAQAVDRFGGKGDKAAATQTLRRASDVVRVGVVAIDRDDDGHRRLRFVVLCSRCVFMFGVRRSG